MKAFRVNEIHQIPDGLTGIALKSAENARASAVDAYNRITAHEIRHVSSQGGAFKFEWANATECLETLSDIKSAAGTWEWLKSCDRPKTYPRYKATVDWAYHGDFINRSANLTIDKFISSLRDAGVPVCEGDFETQLTQLIAIGA